MDAFEHDKRLAHATWEWCNNHEMEVVRERYARLRRPRKDRALPGCQDHQIRAAVLRRYIAKRDGVSPQQHSWMRSAWTVIPHIVSLVETERPHNVGQRMFYKCTWEHGERVFEFTAMMHEGSDEHPFPCVWHCWFGPVGRVVNMVPNERFEHEENLRPWGMFSSVKNALAQAWSECLQYR